VSRRQVHRLLEAGVLIFTTLTSVPLFGDTPFFREDKSPLDQATGARSQIVAAVERVLADSEDLASGSKEQRPGIKLLFADVIGDSTKTSLLITLDFNAEILRHGSGAERELLLHRILTAIGDLTDVSNSPFEGSPPRFIEYRILVDGILLDRYSDEDERLPKQGLVDLEERRGIREGASILGKRIAISPGHGWYRNENQGWILQRPWLLGIVEDFVNSDIAQYLMKDLVSSGVEVRPTRELDKGAGNGVSGKPRWQEAAKYYVKSLGAPSSVWNIGRVELDRDIDSRPLYANWINADSLVSVHNNAGSGSSTGTETLYDTTNGYSVESKRLATAIHDSVVLAIRREYNAEWVDRHIIASNGAYGENRIATRPSVIVETAFMTKNSPDNAALHTESFKQLVARAIRVGIEQYYGPPGSGTVSVGATLDGKPWSGPVSYSVSGGSGFTGPSPGAFPNLPAGLGYTVRYLSGGPGTLIGVVPASSQLLRDNATISWTLQFATACRGEGQTLDVACPPSLSTALRATPASGMAPLTGVTLSASVSGSVQGTINYTFYCNRSDAGVDIRPGFDAKFDGSSENPKTVNGLCNYQSPGPYTAKVIAERGASVAENRFQIAVSSTSDGNCRLLVLARNDSSGGTVPFGSPPNSLGCPSGQYKAGERLQISATPSLGWGVGGWSGTENDASIATTNSVVMPDARLRVTVNYVHGGTGGSPTIAGESADGVSTNAATLHAYVNPNGLGTSANFEYGTGVPTAFVSTTERSVGQSSQAQVFAETVGGLACGSTYTYRAVARNSAGNAAGPYQTFTTLPCGSSLAVTTTSLPDGVTGQLYFAQLTASGGTGSGYTWSLEDGALPVGLNLSAQAGVISGTPPYSNTLATFTIGVRDSGGHFAYRALSMRVRQGLGIDSNRGSNFVFSLGAPYSSANSITYHALGGQAPFSWGATGLPPGLQIDPNTGLLYGTPTLPGDFSAVITVLDPFGDTASLNTVLRVVAGTLIITDSTGHTPPNPAAGTLGVSYTTVFAAQGGSDSGYAWSVQGSLPPGLTSQNGPGCPTYCALFVVGTPTQTGTFSFTVVVRDSLGNSASQGTAIVINSGQPPTINTTKFPQSIIGSPYSTSLSASNGTPPYQWSFLDNSPDPGIQISAAGVLSGTPTHPNDCPTGATDGPALWVGASYPSTYFTVKVTDSLGQSSTRQLCLVSYYPKPVITEYSPAGVVADGQGHTITIAGQNFRSGAVLVNNPGGGHVSVSYVNANALSLALVGGNNGDVCPFRTSPDGLQYFENSYSYAVLQPYSALSNNLGGFAVYDPPPAVTSAVPYFSNSTNPCYPHAGCQLVIQGSGLNINSMFQVLETGDTPGRLAIPLTAPPWNTETVGLFFPTAPGTYTLRMTNGHQPNGQPASVDFHFTVQP
jgi:N-acetylmuramoyl-L-alanine amidase